MHKNIIPIENETDRNIVKKVSKILNFKYDFHKYFTDGASESTVLLVNNTYLIKQNIRVVLESETTFLQLNHSTLFQKILYIDPDFKFLVYQFIPGEPMKKVDDVNDTISKIISTVLKYKPFKQDGFGYLDEKQNSWSDFLQSEIDHSSSNIKEYIPNNEILNKAIQNLEKYPFTKKLLHGDFGTHNFIKENGKLIGIIDPMPVIGDSLYDILFAFASNVQIINTLTLDKICFFTNEPKEKVISLLAIVLYSRISRCLKYHPQDISIYMNWWNEVIKEIN